MWKLVARILTLRIRHVIVNPRTRVLHVILEPRIITWQIKVQNFCNNGLQPMQFSEFDFKSLYVLYISCPKITSNDLIGLKIWRHFRPWKMKTTSIFFSKSSIALEFLLPHFSELNSVNSDQSYVDLPTKVFFQPVALGINTLFWSL